MTLINGTDKADYGDLGLSSSYFGNDYQGITVVYLPELNSNNPPFTVFFNADEKKGLTKVDIYTEMPGPMNAPGKALQSAAKKTSHPLPSKQDSVEEVRSKISLNTVSLQMRRRKFL